MSREDYVRTMVEEEAAATGRRFQLARDLRAIGYEVSTNQLEAVYADAYERAELSLLRSDPELSPDEIAAIAHEVAVDALREPLARFEFDNGATYTRFYGDAWSEQRLPRAQGADTPPPDEVHRPADPDAARRLRADALAVRADLLALEEISARVTTLATSVGVDPTAARPVFDRGIADRHADVAAALRSPDLSADDAAALRRTEHDLRTLSDLADQRDAAEHAVDRRESELATRGAREYTAIRAESDPDARPIAEQLLLVSDRVLVVAPPGEHQGVLDRAQTAPEVAAIIDRAESDHIRLDVRVDSDGRVLVNTADPHAGPESSARPAPVPHDPGAASVDADVARIRAELATTEVGRWAEGVLDSHGVRVVHGSDGENRYLPSQRTLRLDAGATDAEQLAALVHGAIHADTARARDTPGGARDRMLLPRRDYVDAMLDEETRAHAMEIVARTQLRAAGHDLPVTPEESAYSDAFDRARAEAARLDPDVNAAELDRHANEAGMRALRPLVERLAADPTGLTYGEAYGADWDRAHGIHSFDATVRNAMASGEQSVRLIDAGNSVHTPRRVELVTYNDGTQLIRRTMISSRHADAEQLFSALARAVGAPVPEAFRAAPNVVYHQNLPGTTARQRFPMFIDAHELGFHDTDGGRALGLVDALAQIPDRDAGTWMIGPDDGVVGIGNHRAFDGTLTPDTLSPFASHFLRAGDDGTIEVVDHHLTETEIADIRNRVEALRPEFERMLRPHWLDDALGRLDDIGEHARPAPSPAPEVEIGEGDTAYVNRYGGAQRYGISGVVDADGVLHVVVRSGPATPSGRVMFADMMRELGHRVRVIEAQWFSEGGLDDNLTAFNAAIQELFLDTPEEAALTTFTGRLAAEMGFTRVEFGPGALEGPPGEHTSATVRFSRPEATPLADPGDTPTDATRQRNPVDGAEPPDMVPTRGADDSADRTSRRTGPVTDRSPRAESDDPVPQPQSGGGGGNPPTKPPVSAAPLPEEPESSGGDGFEHRTPPVGGDQDAAVGRPDPDATVPDATVPDASVPDATAADATVPERGDSPARPEVTAHEPTTDSVRAELTRAGERIADAVVARRVAEARVGELARGLGIDPDGSTPGEISRAVDERMRAAEQRVERLRDTADVPPERMVAHFDDLRAAQAALNDTVRAVNRIRPELSRLYEALRAESEARTVAGVLAARDVIAAEGAHMISEGVGLSPDGRRVVVASPLTDPDAVISADTRRMLHDRGVRIDYRLVEVDSAGRVTVRDLPTTGERARSEGQGEFRPAAESGPERSDGETRSGADRQRPGDAGPEGEQRPPAQIGDAANERVRPADEARFDAGRQRPTSEETVPDRQRPITEETVPDGERQPRPADEPRSDADAQRRPVEESDPEGARLPRPADETAPADRRQSSVAETSPDGERTPRPADQTESDPTREPSADGVREPSNSTTESEYAALIRERAALASEREFWRAKRNDRAERQGLHGEDRRDGRDPMDRELGPDRLEPTLQRLLDSVVGVRDVPGTGEESARQTPELVGPEILAMRREAIFRLQEAAERFIAASDALTELDRRIAALEAEGATGDRRPSAEVAAELDRLGRERAAEVLRLSPLRAMRDDVAGRLEVPLDRLGPDKLPATLDELARRPVSGDETLLHQRNLELLAEAADRVDRAENEIGRIQDRMAELAGANREIFDAAGARRITDRVGLVDGEHPRIIVVAPRGHIDAPLADHDAALRDALRRSGALAQAMVRPETTIEYRQIVSDREGNWRAVDTTAPVREFVTAPPGRGDPGIHLTRWRDGEGQWNDVNPALPEWNTGRNDGTVPKTFTPRDLPEGVSGWAVNPFQAAVADPFVDPSDNPAPNAVNEALLPQIPGGGPNQDVPSYSLPFADAFYHTMRIILETAKLSGFTWYADPDNPGRVRPGFKGHPWFRAPRPDVQPMAREWNPADHVADDGNLSEPFRERQRAAQEQWARVQAWADAEYARIRADDGDIPIIAENLARLNEAERLARADALLERLRGLAGRDDVTAEVDAIVEELTGRLVDEEPGDAARLVADLRDVLGTPLDGADRAEIVRLVADQLADDQPAFSESDLERIKNHLMNDHHLVRDPVEGVLIRRPLDVVADVAEAWNRLVAGTQLPQDILLLRDALAESDFLRDNPIATWRDANQHAIRLGLDWNASRPPLTDWRADIPYAPRPVGPQTPPVRPGLPPGGPDPTRRLPAGDDTVEDPTLPLSSGDDTAIDPTRPLSGGDDTVIDPTQPLPGGVDTVVDPTRPPPGSDETVADASMPLPGSDDTVIDPVEPDRRVGDPDAERTIPDRNREDAPLADDESTRPQPLVDGEIPPDMASIDEAETPTVRSDGGSDEPPADPASRATPDPGDPGRGESEWFTRGRAEIDEWSADRRAELEEWVARMRAESTDAEFEALRRRVNDAFDELDRDIADQAAQERRRNQEFFADLARRAGPPSAEPDGATGRRPEGPARELDPRDDAEPSTSRDEPATPPTDRPPTDTPADVASADTPPTELSPADSGAPDTGPARPNTLRPDSEAPQPLPADQGIEPDGRHSETEPRPDSDDNRGNIRPDDDGDDPPDPASASPPSGPPSQPPDPPAGAARPDDPGDSDFSDRTRRDSTPVESRTEEVERTDGGRSDDSSEREFRQAVLNRLAADASAAAREADAARQAGDEQAAAEASARRDLLDAALLRAVERYALLDAGAHLIGDHRLGVLDGDPPRYLVAGWSAADAASVLAEALTADPGLADLLRMPGVEIRELRLAMDENGAITVHAEYNTEVPADSASIPHDPGTDPTPGEQRHDDSARSDSDAESNISARESATDSPSGAPRQADPPDSESASPIHDRDEPSGGRRPDGPPVSEADPESASRIDGRDAGADSGRPDVTAASDADSASPVHDRGDAPGSGRPDGPTVSEADSDPAPPTRDGGDDSAHAVREHAEAVARRDALAERLRELADRLPIRDAESLAPERIAATLRELSGWRLTDEQAVALAEFGRLVPDYLAAHAEVAALADRIGLIQEYDRLLAEHKELVREREFVRAKADRRADDLIHRIGLGPDDSVPWTARDSESREDAIRAMHAETGTDRVDITGGIDELSRQDRRLADADAQRSRREAIEKLIEATDRFDELDEQVRRSEQRLSELEHAGIAVHRPASAEAAARIDELARQRAAELQRVKPRRTMRDDLAIRLGVVDESGAPDETALTRDLEETIADLRDRIDAELRSGALRVDELPARLRAVDALADAAADVARAHNLVGRLQDEMAGLAGEWRRQIEAEGGRMVTDRVGIIEGERPRIVVFGTRPDPYAPRTQYDRAFDHAVRTDSAVAQAVVRAETTVEYRRVLADRNGGVRTEPMTPPEVERLSSGWRDGNRLDMTGWRDSEGRWHPVDPTRPDWTTGRDGATLPKKFTPKDPPDGVSGWAMEDVVNDITLPTDDVPAGQIPESTLPVHAPQAPSQYDTSGVPAGVEVFGQHWGADSYNVVRLILMAAQVPNHPAVKAWIQRHPEIGRWVQQRPWLKHIPPFGTVFANYEWFAPPQRNVQPMFRPWDPADHAPPAGRVDIPPALQAEWDRDVAAWQRVQDWADAEYDRFLADDSDIDTIADGLEAHRRARQEAAAREIVDAIREQLVLRHRGIDPTGDVDAQIARINDEIDRVAAELADRFASDDEVAVRDTVADIADLMLAHDFPDNLAGDRLPGETPEDTIARALAAYPRDDTPVYTREQIQQIKDHLMRDAHRVRDHADPHAVYTRRPMDRLADVAEAWNRLIAGEPLPQDLVLLGDALAESDYLRQRPDAGWRDANVHAVGLGFHWDADRPPLTDWRAGIPYAPPPVPIAPGWSPPESAGETPPRPIPSNPDGPSSDPDDGGPAALPTGPSNSPPALPGETNPAPTTDGDASTNTDRSSDRRVWPLETGDEGQASARDLDPVDSERAPGASTPDDAAEVIPPSPSLPDESVTGTVSDPEHVLSDLDRQRAAEDAAAELEAARATRAEAMRGLPVNPEDLASRESVDEAIEGMLSRTMRVDEMAETVRRIEALREAAERYLDAEEAHALHDLAPDATSGRPPDHAAPPSDPARSTARESGAAVDPGEPASGSPSPGGVVAGRDDAASGSPSREGAAVGRDDATADSPSPADVDRQHAADRAAAEWEAARAARAEAMRGLPVNPEDLASRESVDQVVEGLLSRTMRVDEMAGEVARIEALRESAERYLDAEEAHRHFADQPAEPATEESSANSREGDHPDPPVRAARDGVPPPGSPSAPDGDTASAEPSEASDGNGRRGDNDDNPSSNGADPGSRRPDRLPGSALRSHIPHPPKDYDVEFPPPLDIRVIDPGPWPLPEPPSDQPDPPPSTPPPSTPPGPGSPRPELPLPPTQPTPPPSENPPPEQGLPDPSCPPDLIPTPPPGDQHPPPCTDPPPAEPCPPGTVPPDQSVPPGSPLPPPPIPPGSWPGFPPAETPPNRPTPPAGPTWPNQQIPPEWMTPTTGPTPPGLPTPPEQVPSDRLTPSPAGPTPSAWPTPPDQQVPPEWMTPPSATPVPPGAPTPPDWLMPSAGQDQPAGQVPPDWFTPLSDAPAMPGGHTPDWMTPPSTGLDHPGGQIQPEAQNPPEGLTPSVDQARPDWLTPSAGQHRPDGQNPIPGQRSPGWPTPSDAFAPPDRAGQDQPTGQPQSGGQMPSGWPTFPTAPGDQAPPPWLPDTDGQLAPGTHVSPGGTAHTPPNGWNAGNPVPPNPVAAPTPWTPSDIPPAHGSQPGTQAQPGIPLPGNGIPPTVNPPQGDWSQEGSTPTIPPPPGMSGLPTAGRDNRRRQPENGRVPDGHSDTESTLLVRPFAGYGVSAEFDPDTGALQATAIRYRQESGVYGELADVMVVLYRHDSRLVARIGGFWFDLDGPITVEWVQGPGRRTEFVVTDGASILCRLTYRTLPEELDIGRFIRDLWADTARRAEVFT